MTGVVSTAVHTVRATHVCFREEGIAADSAGGRDGAPCPCCFEVVVPMCTSCSLWVFLMSHRVQDTCRAMLSITVCRLFLGGITFAPCNRFFARPFLQGNLQLSTPPVCLVGVCFFFSGSMVSRW